MGTWGDEPWDNDTAADWFQELFDETGFAGAVAQGLRKDPEEHPEVVRAAAHLVALLGHVYVWPVESLDDDEQLAIEQLEALLKAGEGPKRVLRKELRLLKARRAHRQATPPARSETLRRHSPAALPM